MKTSGRALPVKMPDPAAAYDYSCFIPLNVPENPLYYHLAHPYLESATALSDNVYIIFVVIRARSRKLSNNYNFVHCRKIFEFPKVITCESIWRQDRSFSLSVPTLCNGPF